MSSKLLICKLTDLQEDKPFLVKLADKEIVVVKTEEGIFALNNHCPHKGGPLNEGLVDAGCISCPWHGWLFDLRTGESSGHCNYEAETISLTIEEGNVYL